MFDPFPSSTLFLFLFLFLLLDHHHSLAAELLDSICGTSGNFTANSTYESNLITLLSTLASNASASGFANASVGQIPNQVNGLVLCRGDVNTTNCRACLDTANQDARQLCPFNKGAIVWYDLCFLRFSNQQFLGSTDNGQMVMMKNINNATQPERFNQLRTQLLDATTDWAAKNATNRFASGQVSNYTPENPTVYGFVQCLPYMTGFDCRGCLQTLFDPIPDYLEGKQGGRVMGFTCTMRYEIYNFLQAAPTLKLTAQPTQITTEPAAAPAPPPSPTVVLTGPGSNQGSKNVTGTALAVAIPAAAAIALIAFLFIWFCRRRRHRRPQIPHFLMEHKRNNLSNKLMLEIVYFTYENDPGKITSIESILFDASTLRVATANFSEENKLGQGGFGAVYKGLLPNGQEIAVKKLLNTRQGLEELKNELVLVAKLQHRNLVRVLGVCLEEEKMIVYEYVPYRSLDKFLFDPEKAKQLQWGRRHKIISGIARGLLYLHEESQVKIIHRDLKASNILLDVEMNPKISDFGLAKLFEADQTQGVTSRLAGTFGYMAPEYVMRGKFSIKSDVFSFGILVLEIVTGRKNSGSYDSEITAEDLLSNVWGKWCRGVALEIIDPALGGHYHERDVLKCIQIGLLCAQQRPSDRPTMRTIDLMLNSETISLQSPSPPALCVQNNGKDLSISSDSTLQPNKTESNVPVMSSNEVTISEIDPR